MKKALTLLIGLALMVNMVIATDCEAEIIETAEIANNCNCSLTPEQLYMAMRKEINAKLESFMSEKGAKAPYALSDFLITDIYSVSFKGAMQRCEGYSCGKASALSFLEYFTLGEDAKYLPVFEAIYDHILSLIPSSYMDHNAIEHFTLAHVYAGLIFFKDCTTFASEFHLDCTIPEITQFFQAKEKAMGEKSIKRCLERFLDDNPQIYFEFLALKNSFSQEFHGVIKKAGKHIVDFTN